MSGARPSSPADMELAELASAPIPSETRPGVSYRLGRAIGRGGFAIACLAERIGPDGNYPVVLKISRPAIVASSDEMVMRVLKKEVVALGRLNERVPPTPFVVRLLDTGSLRIKDGGTWLALPWIAIEYVHGGIEGETLSKRVRYSIEHTGFAFDPARSANVVRQLALGLTEIHAAQVIHRDLKPSNVLCCGFGENEICKISDFGIARPTGVASTFGKMTLGSPGYVAPEQIHLRDEIGPWTDVFSFAAIVYFLLGGEKYFDVTSPVDGVFAAMADERKSLASSKALRPELRQRHDLLRGIDAVLARGTMSDPRGRFESAEAFARALLPWLDVGPASSHDAPRSSSMLLASETARGAPRDPAAWSWAARTAPTRETLIVAVAWDSDGHCLAPTTRGLSYWDGSRFCELTPAPAHPIHAVRRVGAGRWLLAGEGGSILDYGGDEAREVVRCPAPVTVMALDGQPDDILVLLARDASGGAVLHAAVGRHWLKPLSIEPAAAASGLARLGRETWLVAGRTRQGGGFAAVYRPLEWRLDVVASFDDAALVAAAGQAELGRAVAVGGSHVVRVDGDAVEKLDLGAGVTLSACALDVLGGEWFAGTGLVWFAAGDGTAPRRVYENPRFVAPFVSLHADVGRFTAVSVDAAVLEANSPRQS
jgi:eukaryotic-like serine/threonine-protein kinase